MQIYFSEKDHRYFCPEDPSIKFTSITKLIEMYHEKFDMETIAKKYAEKNGLNAEDVKKMWKEKNEKSVIKGSKFHALKEQELLNKKGVKSFGHSYEGEYKVAKDIYNLQPGLYPELIIWSATHGLIGTSDIVEIFDDGTFIIEDFKTNEKLSFEGYPTFNPKTKKREEKKMFFPINHLGDCNGIHYAIQLSAYAYMLELTGLKLRPNGLTLHHIIFDEEDNHVDTIYYPLNYLKKEVHALFTHFKRINK